MSNDRFNHLTDANCKVIHQALYDRVDKLNAAITKSERRGWLNVAAIIVNEREAIQRLIREIEA